MASWPLPLHVVKVCAVAFHRDELRFTAEEMNNPDVRFKSVGYEFSGIVVSAAPNSPLQLGMEV
ncbi:hypothetical protein N0V88_001064 [Collariella sp. IMI 366227]|nr:hypothetical protein N0V88_001064 [Collariella sp. IMI 366227]